MKVFGVAGRGFGIMAMVFAKNAMNQVSALEKKLKEAGILASGDQAR